MGPTGVGKTELAKATSTFLYGSERAIVRLDMNLFTERHTASALIGAPPGYVGYDDEGQLTGPLRRNPFSIVLLDEVEKAHPDVLSVFLQLFDEGQIRDAQGRIVDATNALFILTSNVLVAERPQLGFRVRADEGARSELLRRFRPELVNRFDDVVVFARSTEPISPA